MAIMRDALSDFTESIKRTELWLYLPWQDVKQRYRRSVLGHLWITLSIAIFVFMIGALWSRLFNIEMSDYLPYFAVSIIIWTFISGVINEAPIVFVSSQSIIKQVSIPLSSYAFALVVRHGIIFLHNIVVFIAVALYYKHDFLSNCHLTLLAICIITFTSVWLSILLGIANARFRDVGQLVPTITQIAIFITPIIWKPELLSGRALYLDFNPFYHYIEIFRAPLLGQVPSAGNYIVTCSISVIGFLVTLIVFNKNKKNIAYWV